MRPELARQQIDQETAAACAAGGSDVAVPSPSTRQCGRRSQALILPDRFNMRNRATTALWFLDAPWVGVDAGGEGEAVTNSWHG